MFVSSHIMIHEPPPERGHTWSRPIPFNFTNMRFDTMDVLYISPFVVREDYTFGTQQYLNPSDKFDDLDGRLEWVIREARRQNSGIKIIAMQMNQKGHDFGRLNGKPDKQETYARSVKNFLEAWRQKPGLRIDGYDVDYEWNDGDDRGNMQSDSANILKLIRRELASTGAGYQLSISPASTERLSKEDQLASVLDYVNMQRYDGGRNTKVQDWIDIGIPPSKLVWGLSFEWPHLCDEVTSIDQAFSKCSEVWGMGGEAGPLAGIMIWRMNSDNWVFEDMASLLVRQKIRNKLMVDEKLEDMVKKGWSNGGRRGRGEGDVGYPAAGFYQSDWDDAKEYRLK